MKKQIIQFCTLPLILTAAGPLHADQRHTKPNRNIAFSVGEELSDAIKNARLSQKQDFPTIDLLTGKAFIDSKVTAKSNPFIGGKYSKYMVWEVKATVLPELFGLDNLPFGASITGTREITFIRQFNSQKESLINYWYNPITKLPKNSSVFDKKEKPMIENENGKPIELKDAPEDYVIRPGDFVGFRAPIMFSVGRGLLTHLTTSKIHPQFDFNLNYFVSGEFDIQVFRIDEDHVQVKILAIQDNNFGASMGVQLVGFDRYGKLAFNRLFNTNILSIYYNDRDSDLFLADYVFNLKSAEARKQYDQLVAGKMKLLSLSALEKNFKHADPTQSLEDKKDMILKELDTINELAKKEWDNSLKDLHQKAVLKIVAGHNESNIVNQGFKLNIMRFVGLDSSSQVTTSRIAMMDGYSLNDVSVYLLNSYSKTFSYDWIWLYGETDRTSLDFLVKTKKDAQNKEIPNEFLGLRINRTKKDLALTEDEYKRLEFRFNSILPEAIKNKLKFPKWDFTNRNSIKNVFVDQEVYFTNEIFDIHTEEFSENNIREGMLNIIKNTYKLQSLPYGMNGSETDIYTNGPHEKLVACYAQNGTDEASLAKKKIAYSYEIENVPKYLASIFSHKTSDNTTPEQKLKINKDKYDKFQHLLNNVPLFREIAGLLLLKLTPDKELEKFVVARLSMSGRKVQPSISTFPDETAFDKTRVFRSLLDQNGYLLDRSYNLRNFFNEDGNIKTLEQIVVR